MALIALLPAYSAHALYLGEPLLQSRWGYPLRAQIEIKAGEREIIEESCLSLVSPEAGDSDAGNYLYGAKLKLQSVNDHTYIVITTAKSLNGLFGKVRLQIKCNGTGTFLRTLTFLPSLEEPAPTPIPETPTSAPATVTAQPAIAAVIAPPVAAAEPKAPVQAAPAHIAAAQPLPVPAKKPAVAAAKTKPQAPTKVVDKPRKQKNNFRLKISSAPIDESRIGKMSKEDRAFLLERQKQLDIDDQTARLLSLQYQLKHLKEELGQAKTVAPVATSSAIPTLKLSELGEHIPAAPRVAAPSDVPRTELPPPAHPASPAPAVKKSASLIMPIAIGLLLAAALLLGFILYRRKTKRAPLPRTQPSSASNRSLLQIIKKALSRKRPAPAPSIGDKTLVLPAIPPQPTNEPSATDASRTRKLRLLGDVLVTMGALSLEDLTKHTADFVPGRDGRIGSFLVSKGKITREQLEHALELQHLNDTDLEFLPAAMSTRTQAPDKAMPASPAATVPTLDAARARSLRLLGNVLVSMGALSLEDLTKQLTEFDPKRDGRIGAFLVSQDKITLEQLDRALEQHKLSDADLAFLPAAMSAAPNTDRNLPMDLPL